jgi:hypothetical protein
MIQRHPARLRRYLGTIAGGIVFAIVVMVVQWNGPREGIVRKAFDVLNYPVFTVNDWIVHTWYRNADQFIPQGVILWMGYWLLLGIALWMLFVWGFNAFSRCMSPIRHRGGEQ